MLKPLLASKREFELISILRPVDLTVRRPGSVKKNQLWNDELHSVPVKPDDPQGRSS